MSDKQKAKLVVDYESLASCMRSAVVEQFKDKATAIKLDLEKEFHQRLATEINKISANIAFSVADNACDNNKYLKFNLLIGEQDNER